MTEQSAQQSVSGPAEAARHRAEIFFGVLSFAAALFLLTQIGAQTTWIDGRRFVEQPAFWPTLSIAGMTVFGAMELFHCWRRNRRRPGRGAGTEIIRWAKAIEYVAWFMGYVWIVPLIGYLPATLMFCAALAWRLGYRDARAVLGALLTGAATVLVFKAFLGVRIPGGALYELLPDGLRNFMIVYL